MPTEERVGEESLRLEVPRGGERTRVEAVITPLTSDDVLGHKGDCL